jgi:hypothetical protein
VVVLVEVRAEDLTLLHTVVVLVQLVKVLRVGVQVQEQVKQILRVLVEVALEQSL